MQTEQTTAGRQGQNPAQDRGGRCAARIDTVDNPNIADGRASGHAHGPGQIGLAPRLTPPEALDDE